MKFSEFGFSPEVLGGIEAMRFTEATAVQEKTIPLIMEGKDLIACAQTGTGKTAAFLLPILNKIANNIKDLTTTLILVPTRELAIQIDQHIQGFSYFLPVTSVAVYGGNDAELWDQQKKALISGANLVVATPGRLIQHLNMDYFNFSSLKHLILDEADRMLDMGFFDDIMQIVKVLPKDRQTLLYSATMPPKIRELSKNLLKSPVEVNIAISRPAEGILQAAYLVWDSQKVPLIVDLLKGKELNSVLIFASTKLKVKEIFKVLKQLNFVVDAIHSDLDQSERESVMLGFRNRKVKILVATDIVSRGIDVDGIDLVINYDVPNDAEDYVHRVGRTARANTTGVALTFINDRDQYSFAVIEKLIEREVYKLQLPEGFEPGPEYKPFAKPERPSYGKKKAQGNFRKKRKHHTKRS